MTEEFNQKFIEWQRKNNLRAEFGWRYENQDGVKKMEVNNIRMIVYDKPVPGSIVNQLSQQKAP